MAQPTSSRGWVASIRFLLKIVPFKLAIRVFLFFFQQVRSSLFATISSYIKKRIISLFIFYIFLFSCYNLKVNWPIFSYQLIAKYPVRLIRKKKADIPNIPNYSKHSKQFTIKTFLQIPETLRKSFAICQHNKIFVFFAHTVNDDNTILFSTITSTSAV